MRLKKISLLLVLTLALPSCANHRQNPNKINLSNTNTGSISTLKNNSDSKIRSKLFSPIILDNISSLQRKTINWSWAYSPRDNSTLISKYHAYAFGKTSKKVIYMTFDEGYAYFMRFQKPMQKYWTV